MAEASFVLQSASRHALHRNLASAAAHRWQFTESRRTPAHVRIDGQPVNRSAPLLHRPLPSRPDLRSLLERSRDTVSRPTLRSPRRGAGSLRTACLAVLLLTAFQTACLGNRNATEQGTSSDASAQFANVQACTSNQPGPRLLRRLTGPEFNTTLVDLFKSPNVPQANFFTAVAGRIFNNDANQLLVDPTLAQLLMIQSEAIAGWATQNLAAFAPCADATDACAQQIIGQFGKRAFRRPLTDDDTKLYTQLYNTGKGAGDFAGGMTAVFSAMLQSPYFLYRFEAGQPTAGGQTFALDSYEVATELSYYLTGSMPDDELMQAADGNDLSSPDQVKTQAMRLLGGNTQRLWTTFMTQLLNVTTLPTLTRDTTVYPAFNAKISQAMTTEINQYVNDVAFAKGGTFSDLFAQPTTFINSDLATYYGMSGGPANANFQEVPVGTQRVGGLLGLGGVLATNADFARSSPVLRGKLVRTHLFCQAIPPPPSGVPTALQPVADAKTTRQVFAAHERSASCAACHKLMDSLGDGFENFDGAGVFRSQENGVQVDSSNSIEGIFAQPKSYSGLTELQSIIGSSPQAQQCFALNLMSFAYGLDSWKQNGCTLNAITHAAAPSNYRLEDLILAVTAAPNFYQRATP